MERYTISQFNEDFPTEEACLDHVAALVYPTWPEAHCRKCEEVTKHHRLKSRKAFTCQKCGTHIYPLAGTIFEKSRTPLKSWFYAMYLMSTTRRGISAKQMERELGVTYKTAWRMFKQIRELFDEDGDGPLTGTVEMDETYVGGRPRYRGALKPEKNQFGQTKKGRRALSHPNQKKPVFGMVTRGGQVRALATGDTKGTTLMPIIEAHILPGTMVFTDEAMMYRSLTRRGYPHKRVHHQAKVYVDGDVHTNTIEGFWSLLKKGIGGVYNAVGADYLQNYVNEYAFRYNHRKDDAPMFRTMAGRVRVVRTGRFGGYAPLG